jgi:ABC transporter substrate binding protein
MVLLKPDVIVMTGTGFIRTAKQMTGTIPIIVAGAGGLVETGVVANLARPGGNVTGTTNISSDLSIFDAARPPYFRTEVAFVRDKHGNLTFLRVPDANFPGSVAATIGTGISDDGAVVGWYCESYDQRYNGCAYRGFRDGKYRPIDALSLRSLTMVWLPNLWV